MNYYHKDDKTNAIMHMHENKYSSKTKNVYYFAPECIKLDMYVDFENDYMFSEETFMEKYAKVVYRINFKK